jgi:DNA-binding NarL/FixJ family response regulator
MHPNPAANVTNDTVLLPSTVRSLAEEASDHLAGLARIIDRLEGLLAARSGPAAVPVPRQESSSSERKISFLTSSIDQRLTEREQEVLGLLVQGLTNRRIARTLRISEPTVKNHLHAIFLKLGVTDRTQAIVKVLGPDAHRL